MTMLESLSTVDSQTMFIMAWTLETGKGRVDLGKTGRQGTELFSKKF